MPGSSNKKIYELAGCFVRRACKTIDNLKNCVTPALRLDMRVFRVITAGSLAETQWSFPCAVVETEAQDQHPAPRFDVGHHSGRLMPRLGAALFCRSERTGSDSSAWSHHCSL